MKKQLKDITPNKTSKEIQQFFNKKGNNFDLTDVQWFAVNNWKVFVTFSCERDKQKEVLKFISDMNNSLTDKKYQLTFLKRNEDEERLIYHVSFERTKLSYITY